MQPVNKIKKIFPIRKKKSQIVKINSFPKPNFVNNEIRVETRFKTKKKVVSEKQKELPKKGDGRYFFKMERKDLVEFTALLVALDEDEDSEELDQVLIAAAQKSLERVEHPRIPPIRLDLTKFTAGECKLGLIEIKLKGWLWRYTSRQLLSKERYEAHAEEALCIVLRRLVYPNRWYELVPFFGRSASALSDIFLTTINTLYQRYSFSLFNFHVFLYVSFSFLFIIILF